MNISQAERMETMINTYTEFLNLHRQPDIDDYTITRADYDEYNDGPHIIFEHWVWDDDEALMMIYANPFHDEGGPHYLTAWFERDYSDEEQLIYTMRHMIQEFDTERTMIWARGEVINLWKDEVTK